MTQTGDGVEHPTHHRARHVGGDGSVGKLTDSASSYHGEAHKAAEKMARQVWAKPEDEKHAKPHQGNIGTHIIQASEKAESRPTNSHLPVGAMIIKSEKRQEALADNRFNNQVSVDKLVESGAMKAAAGNMGDMYIKQAAHPADGPVRNLDKNPVNHIDVRYSDTAVPYGEQKPAPDFRVKLDGSVEVLRNPDHTSDKRLTVEVERPPGDAGRMPPPPEQQKAVNQLVDYLSGRYMRQSLQQDGSVQRDGTITDNQGLVSDQTRQAEHSRPTPMDQMPDTVRNQVQRINRHGGRGQFSPEQAAEDFAPRDVPRQSNENDKIAAMKDIASGFMTRGERDPYHSVHTWPDQGHRVGRYGISAHQYTDWLKGLSSEEIQKMIAEGKLPAGAADLQKSLLEGKDGSELTGDAKDMKNFLDKMAKGQEPLSTQEMDKYMGKGLQEQMGTDLLKSYAVATADRDSQGRPAQVNVGKLALSMVLGHAVTDQEAGHPQNKQIMDAAYKQYALAVMHEQNPTGAVDMSNAGGKIAAVAQADRGRALWVGDLGSGNLGCASSVSRVLRESGVANVRELSVAGLERNLMHRGWQRTSFENRQPGDVIIVLGGARHGHTGVVGENPNVTYNNHSGSGRWSQDGAEYWYRRARGQRLYVLRAPGNA